MIEAAKIANGGVKLGLASLTVHDGKYNETNQLLPFYIGNNV